ncbi:DEAD/DEAH box helicase family protein [Sulfurirhabdus autotrophica]|uniref:Type III restriction enzyme n=1 Tax=Sulfurirhabdus autotrophica TaxID=1706046 RepID=A0A4R3XV89_9PROT|nr:DEAD/DEAH box helicase family protein [Sulfurirhabdus autotrophica]TCV82691.1 type III restriction enzyme [Sulfurirhabdus autotrophica]
MNLALIDFQKEYVAELLTKLLKAKRNVREGDLEAVLLSAPTGSGKTVMMTAVAEHILFGAKDFEPEPEAVLLWLSDQPELNEQSRNRILSASSMLRAHQLVVVGPDFDRETLEGGKVYFLNTQKLGRDKNLTTKGDKRTWTMWETIRNTAKKLGGQFYVVIDEAHRGMNQGPIQERDAQTVMQKFLLGSPGELEPMPIVLGVTATPERFERLIGRSDRRMYKVLVDVDKVRNSGLLKDRLAVRIPEDDQPNDWSLLAAAVQRWKVMRDAWRDYCLAQQLEVVSPIMVIQVADGSGERLTATDLEIAVRTIESEVGALDDLDLAHAFMEEKEISTSGHRIRRLDASKISADPDVKFVFFKMALTTGWDCPRAEVMMSFRPAQDATYIAQLIGRMVRTPLARRIEGSETLNEVHLYLPYFDRENLDRVIQKLKGDPETVPATEVTLGSDLVELGLPPAPVVITEVDSGTVPSTTAAPSEPPVPAIPLAPSTTATSTEEPPADESAAPSLETSEAVTTAEVETAAELEPPAPSPLLAAHLAIHGLPTYTFSQGKKLPDFRRLLKFAQLLSILHGVDAEALPGVKKLVVDTLTAQRDALLISDADFKSALEGLAVITIKPIVVDHRTFEITAGEEESIEVTEQNVEDLFRQCKQRLSDDLCLAYLKQNHHDEEPHRAKLELYLLLQQASIWQALDTAAKDRLQSLKTKNMSAIRGLPSNKRQRYDEVWATARVPEAGYLELPDVVNLPVCKECSAYDKHLFQEADGKFRADFNGWEKPIINSEIPDCVAWLRNVPKKPWALCYPYRMGGEWKPGYPDFLVVRKDGDGLVVDILEPHAGNQADAWYKAQGLAEFADRHGTHFGRIEMERVDGTKITRLDFNDPSIRARGMTLANHQELDNLFRDAGVSS